ncbi:heat shock 70 kDa protein 8 [Carica papaya]|uniref:heat shock 70 kDa protein 8 n=1 Tax=Carica papaya TaxID=3649 RepID=UPI000B8CFE70|nr:heat shock 70 kDa protein 8 [Carica papaya]XP_021897178.1 heat shock 70 kDa protein 8 [Carica papaya]
MAEPEYTVASDNETSGNEKSFATYPETAIGIDIGTYTSSVAVWNGSQVEILKNARSQRIMRSYVIFKDDDTSSGVSNSFSHELEMLSGAAMFNMKRLIGRVDTDPVVHASSNVPFLVQTLGIGVRPLVAVLVNNVWRSTTPEEVLAIFLIELKAMAEVHLKRPVRNVVLSIPASFSRFQLSRIDRACAMAGLQVLRLMPEPTSVALLYTQQQQQAVQGNMGSGSEKIALIFNMGAGFCDVAVTATAGGVSQIKALTGAAIGGEDILQNVMRHLVPNLDSLFSNHGINEIKALSLLRLAAQDAIHRLSTKNNVQIDVDLGNGTKICKVVDREEFEMINSSIFEKCESLVVQCLQGAKVEVEDVADLILVGGCSCIPKIRNLLKGICKKDELYNGINPLEGAVWGAALEGAVTSGIFDPMGSLDLLTIQATPLGIGIRAAGNNFVPIIPKNSTMPVRKELVFTTVSDNQTEAVIAVYEGEGKKVEDNHLLGYFKILGIPQAPKGVPEINVCMDINSLSVLRVLVGVMLPGTQHPPVPAIEVRMPTVEEGHGWCAEALHRIYGSNMELVTVKRKI